MRSHLAIAAAAVAIGLLPAAAQTQKGSYPWETQADRFYQRGADLPSYDPNAETERQLRRLGLKPNKPIDKAGGGNVGSPKDGQSARLLRRFDTDHNGSISRSEYLGGRAPPGSFSDAGRTRAEVARLRSRSRFNAADRDHNGTLSPDEVNGIRDPRF